MCQPQQAHPCSLQVPGRPGATARDSAQAGGLEAAALLQAAALDALNAAVAAVLLQPPALCIGTFEEEQAQRGQHAQQQSPLPLDSSAGNPAAVADGRPGGESATALLAWPAGLAGHDSLHTSDSAEAARPTRRASAELLFGGTTSGEAQADAVGSSN